VGFRIFLVLLIFLIVFPSSVFAAKEFSVGVSPPVIDLGDVSSGSSIPTKFYIVTPSDETLLVRIEPTVPLIDFFKSEYSQYLYNYSEEITTGWVQLFSNPVELSPQSDTSIFGNSIKGYREINFLINVPKSSEPGYHLIKLLPQPSLPSSGNGQVGVQVATITPITILMRLPGEAIRQGKILDISTGRYFGNNLELKIFFINTGTVSISTFANSIEVTDNQGNSVVKSSSDIKTVKPGETQVLTAMLPTKDVPEGDYKVKVNVDYTTGSAQMSSFIGIHPQVAASIPKVESIPSKFPFWILILIAVVIVSIIVYRFSREEK
jgi:hypothetical protein